MPRGFLVKRSRRLGGSYRLRPPPALPGEAPLRPAPFAEPPRPPPTPGAPLTAVWEAAAAAPAAQESEPATRCPASPEPCPPAEEGLPRTPSPPPPPPPLPLPLPAAACPPKRPPRAKAPPPAKKPKAARKLSFADEETTSPVLGLRIKAAGEEGGGGGGGGQGGPRAARPALLGEFVCQLCKEPYADPPALAQHRCSRIVRVEYRCPECHKLFSCPANLASHRRWHKPRPPAPAPAPAPAPPAHDKENSTAGAGGALQHQGGRDSSSCRRPPSPPPPPQRRPPAPPAHDGPGPAPGGELFLCPYCHKAFRRQAYLRKHLATHQPPAAAYRASPPPRPPLPAPQPLAFPCHLCGAHFPSAPLRDKHRLWHAVREELLLPLGPADAPGPGPPPPPPPPPPQIFSCKHCPATFFSSPGLTRHINKCHPSENRQVLLLQMPVRPGC